MLGVHRTRKFQQSICLWMDFDIDCTLGAVDQLWLEYGICVGYLDRKLVEQTGVKCLARVFLSRLRRALNVARYKPTVWLLFCV